MGTAHLVLIGAATGACIRNYFRALQAAEPAELPGAIPPPLQVPSKYRPIPSKYRPGTVQVPSTCRPSTVQVPSKYRPSTVWVPSTYRPRTVQAPSKYRPSTCISKLGKTAQRIRESTVWSGLPCRPAAERRDLERLEFSGDGWNPGRTGRPRHPRTVFRYHNPGTVQVPSKYRPSTIQVPSGYRSLTHEVRFPAWCLARTATILLQEPSADEDRRDADEVAYDDVEALQDDPRRGRVRQEDPSRVRLELAGVKIQPHK
eukprot:gene3267-biopygen112